MGLISSAKSEGLSLLDSLPDGDSGEGRSLLDSLPESEPSPSPPPDTSNIHFTPQAGTQQDVMGIATPRQRKEAEVIMNSPEVANKAMNENFQDAYGEYADIPSKFVKGATWNYADAIPTPEDAGMGHKILSGGAHLAGMGAGLLMPTKVLSVAGAIPKFLGTAGTIISGIVGAGEAGAIWGAGRKPEEGETRVGNLVSDALTFAAFGGASGVTKGVASKLSPTIRGIFEKAATGETLTASEQKIYHAFELANSAMLGGGAGATQPAKDWKDRLTNIAEGAGGFAVAHGANEVMFGALGLNGAVKSVVDAFKNKGVKLEDITDPEDIANILHTTGYTAEEISQMHPDLAEEVESKPQYYNQNVRGARTPGDLTLKLNELSTKIDKRKLAEAQNERQQVESIIPDIGIQDDAVTVDDAIKEANKEVTQSETEPIEEAANVDDAIKSANDAISEPVSEIDSRGPGPSPVEPVVDTPAVLASPPEQPEVPMSPRESRQVEYLNKTTEELRQHMVDNDYDINDLEHVMGKKIDQADPVSVGTALQFAKNLMKPVEATNNGSMPEVQQEAVKPESAPPVRGEDVAYTTGQPVTLAYIHNKEKSPNMGERFGQHIEPTGRYLNEKPSTFRGEDFPNIEEGTVDFKNPLVMDWGGGYSEPTNWKQVLSAKYGGKKGTALSKAIIKDGYDGIITLDKNGNTSEIVDLTGHKSLSPMAQKAKSLKKGGGSSGQEENGQGREVLTPERGGGEPSTGAPEDAKGAEDKGKSSTIKENLMVEKSLTTDGTPLPEKKEIPKDLIFHNTDQESLESIKKEGMDAGSFSKKPIDFGGDVYIAVSRSDLKNVQEHTYGNAIAIEPQWEFGHDDNGDLIRHNIPPERIYLTDKKGKVIGSLPDGDATPHGYASLPESTRTKFESAWDGKDIAKMQEYIHPDNKNLRAEFEHRTGEKLPKTVKGTDAAVEEYFTRVEEGGKDKVYPPLSAEPPLSDIDQTRADYEAARVTEDKPAEVVAEAVKTAKKEGTPLKEQKKYLLANIDEAIKEAHEELSDEHGLPRGELNSVRDKITSADIRKSEATQRLKVWEDPKFSPHDKTAEEKQAMVDEFKKTIEDATAEMKELIPQEQSAQQAVRDSGGYVTIHVPDDGTFEVFNTKDSLKQFKEKVSKLFPTTDTASQGAKGYGTTPKQTKARGNIADAGEFTTPDGEVWHGNGHLVIKGKPRSALKPSKDPEAKERIEYWKTDPPDVSRIIPDISKMSKVEKVDFLGEGKPDDSARGTDNGKTRAISDTPINSAEEPYARLKVDGQPDVYLSQDYYLYAKEHHPKAEVMVGKGDGPVAFVENGNVVAVVMPRRTDRISDDIKSQTLDFMGLQQAYEALVKIGKAGKESLPHLLDIGKSVYESGAQNYRDFARGMKEHLGDLWSTFKSSMERVWFLTKKAYRMPFDVMMGTSGDVGGKTEPVKPQRAEMFVKHEELTNRAAEAIDRGDRDECYRLLDEAKEITKSEEWKQYGKKPANPRTDPEQERLAELARKPKLTDPEAQEVEDLAVKEDPPPTEEKQKVLTDAADRIVGIKNAMVEEERDAISVDQVEKIKLLDNELLDEGKHLVESGTVDPYVLTAKILNNKSGPISITDEPVLLHHKRLLSDEQFQTNKDIASAKERDDKAEIAALMQKRSKLYTDLDRNQQATTHLGTVASSVLRIRQWIEKNDYSYERLVAEYRSKTNPDPNTGKIEVPEEVKQKIAEMSEQLKAASDELVRLQADHAAQTEKISQLEAEKLVRNLQKEEARSDRQEGRTQRKQTRVATTEARAAEREIIRQRINAKLHPDRLNAGIPLDVVPDLILLAKSHIMDGVTKAVDLFDAVHTDVQDLLDGVSVRDVRDAMTNYGITFKMSQDKTDAALREMKRQGQVISKIEDAESGILPRKSGLERDPETDELRNMKRELNQIMRASGLDTLKSPESRMKTALDAVKTRLKNDIADLDRQIAAKKRDPVQKTGVKYDDEALNLKAIRDAKQKALNEIDAKPGVSEARRIEIAIDSIKKSIENYRRQIETGDIEKPKNKTPDTPEIIKLRSARDALKKKRDEKRELRAEMAKKGVPDEDPNITNLNEFMKLTEMRIRVKEKALDRAIEEQSRKIKDNELETLKKPSLTPDTPTITSKQAVLDSLKETYKQMQKDAKPPKDPDAAKRKRYATWLNNQIGKLEARKAAFEADPAKALEELKESRKRTPIAPDPAIQAQQLKYAELKLDIDNMMLKQQALNRGWDEKAIDGFLGWRRAVILSSEMIYAKLGAAATVRIITTPVEDAMGAVLAKMVPLIGKIAEQAPVEGQFNWDAQESALSHILEGRTWKTAYDKAAGHIPILNKFRSDNAPIGKNYIDVMYGSKKYHSDSWLDTFGNIHGALKTPAQINEFYRSYAKLMKWHAEHGYDVTDPAVEASIGATAYLKAQQAIFMSKSGLSKIYTSFASQCMKSTNPGIKAFGVFMKTELPIVTVPVNIAAELQLATTGGVNAIWKLIAKKTINSTGPIDKLKRLSQSKGENKWGENFTQEEADYFMRAIKKQALGGLILAVTAPYLLQFAGGYFDKENKRNPGDPKPMDFMGIPHVLMHNVPMQAIQVFATAQRVIKSERDRGEDFPMSLIKGTFSGFRGNLSELPFFRSAIDLAKAASDWKNFSKHVGQLTSSMVIPPTVSNIAKKIDHDTPRKVDSFADAWESKIPGLRGNLSLNKHAAKSEIIGQLKKGEDLTEDQQNMLNRMTDKEVRSINKEADSTPEFRVFKGIADPVKAIRALSYIGDSSSGNYKIRQQIWQKMNAMDVAENPRQFDSAITMAEKSSPAIKKIVIPALKAQTHKLDESQRQGYRDRLDAIYKN